MEAAAGNIACLYLKLPSGIKTFPIFGFAGDGPSRTLSYVSIGLQEQRGGEALCSRFVVESKSGKQIIEQAYYLVSGEGYGPDAADCSYPQEKLIKIVSRFKKPIFQSEFTQITAENFQLVHYNPTPLETKKWLIAKNMDSMIAEKCIALKRNYYEVRIATQSDLKKLELQLNINLL